MWWIKRALELPPRLLLKKAASAASHMLRHASRWARDRLAQALDDNLKKFEGQFGEIKVWGTPQPNSKTIGFGLGDEDEGKSKKK